VRILHEVCIPCRDAGRSSIGIQKDETQSVLVNALWPPRVRPDNNQVSISASNIGSLEGLCGDAFTGACPTSSTKRTFAAKPAL
jgi:hypothetical protein